MFIEKAGLSRDTLKGKTVILTGAGGGIGYETARALVWLGAIVIIAEINSEKGKNAERSINDEFGGGAEFYEIDLSDERQITALVTHAKRKYGFVDVVFNNATMIAVGAVEDVSITSWDKSYAVNFRAPLLLTQLLLPEMKARNSGTVIFVSSSGAAPYMGAYEVFKTSQVELSNTLAGELEDTHVNSLTIGPGLVKTDTAMNGIKSIAALMGMSTEDFYKLNEKHMISPEEAAVGFVLAVVHAGKYRGQEISSIQALSEANMYGDNTPKSAGQGEASAELKALVSKAAKTYYEQYDGWMRRNLFEKQWVLRDFKKYVGASAEQFRSSMQDMEAADVAALSAFRADFEKLKGYYDHQLKLLQGFEKNPQKLKENSDIIRGWMRDIDDICALL